MRKTLDFIQACDNDQNLFVFYYAGHGRMNSARQAEWVSGQGPNSPFVDWSAIQGLFGAAKSDVLILLDTCAAASSATTSQFAVIETIAACGFERRAPPPGEHSLTNALIDVLRDWINKPSFSAASLHTEILFRLKLKETKKGREGIPLEWCVTPIHWINTKDYKAPGIEICRRNVLLSLSAMPTTEASNKEAPSTFIDGMDIDFNNTSSTSTPLSSVSSDGSYKVPHVLISLQLEENQPLDARQCARWLDKFPLLAKWVKVEAVFPSYSTLMILSVPMPIWDMLPDHPACSFIGYVTAPNIGGLFMSEEVPTVEVPIVSDTNVQAGGSDTYYLIPLSQMPTITMSQTFEDRSSWVMSVAFSHDSKLLASASADNTAKVWDATTGACQQTLKGHNGWVNSVAFPHDSKLLASASGDGTVRVWNAITGACQRTLKCHRGRVISVAFSHDSKLLASASNDRTVKVWDAMTGAYQQTLKGHRDRVKSVAFSHDSKLLASASADKTVKVWDATTGACQQTLKGHNGWVNSVAFPHDSKLLASASADKTVKVWDATTGACQQTLKGHNGLANSVAFSHDSKLLASASDDGTVKVWDAITGACQRTLKCHRGRVISVAFSHDSKLLALASGDGTVRVWDASIGSHNVGSSLYQQGKARGGRGYVPTGELKSERYSTYNIPQTAAGSIWRSGSPLTKAEYEENWEQRRNIRKKEDQASS
jgi:WD40 repeat protein